MGANRERTRRGLAMGAILLALLAAQLSAFDLDELRGDERAYAIYTEELAAGVATDFRPVARRYVDEERLHRFPNPLRVGYLLATTAAVRVFGGLSIPALAAVSLVSCTLLVACVFWWTERRFGLRTAGVASVLLGSAPLLHFLSRKVYSDAPYALLVVATLLAFQRLVGRGERAGPFDAALFAAGLTACFLTKELTLLLVPLFPLLLVAGGERVPRRTLVLAIAALVAAPLAALAAMALLLRGDASLGFRVYQTWIDGMAANPYLATHAGPWYTIVLGLVTLSPVTALAGIAFCIAPGEEDGGRSRWLKIVVVYLLVAFGMASLKDPRWWLFIESFLAVGAAVMIVRAAGARRTAGVAIAVVCLFAAGYNAFQFRRFFVAADIHDPLPIDLFRANGVIPQGPAGSGAP